MFKFDFQYAPSSHSPSHNKIENYKNKKSVTEPKPHTHTNVHAHTWCCVLNKKTLHKATLLKRWFLIMSIWIKYRFEKNIRTPIFIAALFVIAKIWKQPKCLSVDEWIKQLWDIYTMEFYSAIKKEENVALCNSMDGLREHYAKWNKPVKERQIPYDDTHMWNLMNKLN